jgi:hypothetical protein
LAINFVFPQESKNKRRKMLHLKEIQTLKELVELAMETRMDLNADDTPFATLSALQAKLTHMEIEYEQNYKFRRANQKQTARSEKR